MQRQVGRKTSSSKSADRAGRLSLPYRLLAASCVLAVSTMVGCGSDTRPVAMDIYIDGTYSNYKAAPKCLDDILAAGKVAAITFGTLSVHTFDGDPLRRRGLNHDFSEVKVPRKYEGTSLYDDYVEENAKEEIEALRSQIEELTNEFPEVGETPLVGVLIRAGRAVSDADPESVHRILICTDGLFTDVPQEATQTDIESLDSQLVDDLSGATVDFIGVADSAPDRGPTTQRIRPGVEELVGLDGGKMGVWDVELPASWSEQVEQEAQEGGK